MKLQEIIQDAKKTAPQNSLVQNLIRDFEEYSELYSKRDTVNQEDLAAFTQKLNDSQTQLSLSFALLAASYGLTAKEMQAYLENPKNFNPADWENIQTTRRQIESNLNIPTDIPKSPKIKNQKFKI